MTTDDNCDKEDIGPNEDEVHDDDDYDDEELNALWSITVKNTDWSTGPLANPFARGTVNDWIAILSVFFFFYFRT